MLLCAILLSSCFPSYLINRRVGKNKFEKIKEVQAIISKNLPKIEKFEQKSYISTEQNVKDIFDFLSVQEQDKIILLLEEEVTLISVENNRILFEIRSSNHNPFIFYQNQKLTLIYCNNDSYCSMPEVFSDSKLLKKIENNWFLVLDNESNKIRG